MDRVCPLLALGADRRTAVDGVDAAHRCHALDPPASLERDRQSQLCLTLAHQRCERYLAHLSRTNRPSRSDLPIGDGLRSTRLVLAPEPSWRGMAGRARRSPRGLVAVLVIAGTALGGATAVAAGIGVARSTAALPSPSASTRASESAGPGSTAAATPTDAPLPAPSVAASPPATAAVTPSAAPPTPAPTAPPTTAPTPQPTYVVVAGDTLALIAQRFGVTVAALQATNGIEDPNEILIGQVLVIP